MKKHRNITALLMAAFLFLVPLLPMQTFAETNDGLSLSVSYDAKCGEATTFTLNAEGGSGNYVYYLSNITREGEDGNYFVIDPSKLPGFKPENTFEVTFVASGIYNLDFLVMDKGVTPAVTKREKIKIVLNDPNYPTIEAIADSVAAQCKASCSTDFDRALWLHDWLLDNCEYDYSYLYCNAEGALARGTGTCEAYHRAYTMLLNRVGIANGRAEGNGHVWTVAKLDGNWYQIDVTWDDNGYSNHTYANYLYFGLDDRIMTMVHSDHTANENYLSNSLKQNYFIKTGKIHQWSDPFETTIQQNLNAGNTSFEIPVTDNTMPDSYMNVIYNLAAYQLSTQDWSTATHTVKISADFRITEKTKTRAADTLKQMYITAAYTPIEENHIWDEGTITIPATCTKSGLITYTCSHCDKIKTETIPVKAHTVVTDKAVAPTCTKTGLTEGSHCSVCNTVLVAQETVPVIAHTVVTDKAVAPTCTKAGLTEGSHCSVCNTVLVAQETVPVIAHTVVTDKAVAPTCAETGLTEGSHCSVCNTIITAQQTVPAIPHTAVTDKAVAPTCTNTGLTEGSHCSVCNTVITAQQIIPATGHSYDDGEITKPASSTETGLKTYTCEVCGDTKTEIISATGDITDNTDIKDTDNKTDSADKSESASTTQTPQTSEKSPETGAEAAKATVCFATVAAACALISATVLNKKKKTR